MEHWDTAGDGEKRGRNCFPLLYLFSKSSTISLIERIWTVAPAQEDSERSPFGLWTGSGPN